MRWSRRSHSWQTRLPRERTVSAMTDERDDKKTDDDYDLSEEKVVAPEENIPELPHPTPVDPGAPAP